MQEPWWDDGSNGVMSEEASDMVTGSAFNDDEGDDDGSR